MPVVSLSAKQSFWTYSVQHDAIKFKTYKLKWTDNTL